MDLKRMQHVIALADERNFRAAADRVHLTQPAFSRSIQAAEEEWGMKLFDRGGAGRGGVVCTAAGAHVVDRIRRVVDDWRALERDVVLYRDHEIGDLCMGMGPYAANTYLGPLLLDLRGRHPAVKLRVQVNNPAVLMQYVHREEHDFFFGDVRHARSDPAFDITPVGGQPGALYVRSGHPLLSSRTLLMADLAPFGLVTSRLPEEVQTVLCKLMGLTMEEGLPIAVECDDIQLLKTLVLGTESVMVAVPDLVREELKAGTLQALTPQDLPQVHTALGVVSLRGRTLSPVATYAVGFLTRMVAEMGSTT
jgi:DNA-binding transcriptional LysR family regulator